MNQELSDLLVHQKSHSLLLMNSTHGNLLSSLKSTFVVKLYNATSVGLYATNMVMIIDVGSYFLMKSSKLHIIIMIINKLY